MKYNKKKNTNVVNIEDILNLDNIIHKVSINIMNHFKI